MYQYISFIVALVILNGCSNYNLKEYIERSIGNTSYKDRLKAESYPSSSPCVQKWKDEKINKDYYLPNGNLIHVYPAGCGCVVHWEFDKETKLLVGYKLQGERCSSL